ncbi:MAG: hypothetical protein ACQEVA_10425 [Myxococcota bacterium]
MYSEYMTVASHPTFSSIGHPARGARGLRLILLLVVLGVALLMSGCTKQATPDPPQGVGEMAPSVVLHHAAVSVLEDEGHEIDVESQKQLFVTTSYDLYDENLKRRYKAEVIRGPQGVMGLKVTVDYQRRLVDDGEETWVPHDNASLRERARPWEVQMGRAIERRFERWMGR